jgi:hypothetical protein
MTHGSDFMSDIDSWHNAYRRITGQPIPGRLQNSAALMEQQMNPQARAQGVPEQPQKHPTMGFPHETSLRLDESS